ncbi:MAG: hypothetical protein GX603_08985 [Chloroflexi bacterium]|nr:hypothetical protein [Chloroflexota bacterium]
MNTNPNINIENYITQAMDQPMPDQNFKNSLRLQLAKTYRKPEKKIFSRLKFRPVFLTILAVLLGLFIAFLYINPNAVNAIRSIFSFIPGVGLTNSTSGDFLIVGEEAVKVEGVTFQVDIGYATSKETVLLLKVSGLSPEMLYTEDEHNLFPKPVYKLLSKADKPIELTEQGARWDGTSGYEIKLIGPALEKFKGDYKLTMTHTPFANPELSPTEIELPVSFNQISDPEIGLPVIDISLPLPLFQTEENQELLQSQESNQAEETEKVDPLQINGIKIVQEADGTILFGRLSWNDDSLSIPRFSPLNVALKNDDGESLPIDFYPVQEERTSNDLPWLAWAFKTKQPLGSGNYELAFEGLVERIIKDSPIIIPAEVLSDHSKLKAYEVDIDLDGISIVLSDFSVSQAGAESLLSFIIGSEAGVEGAMVFTESFSGLSVSQIDSGRIKVELRVSGAVDLSDGSVLIKSIDSRMKEAISENFVIP